MKVNDFEISPAIRTTIAGSTWVLHSMAGGGRGVTDSIPSVPEIPNYSISTPIPQGIHPFPAPVVGSHCHHHAALLVKYVHQVHTLEFECPNGGVTLGQRRRRRPNVKPPFAHTRLPPLFWHTSPVWHTGKCQRRYATRPGRFRKNITRGSSILPVRLARWVCKQCISMEIGILWPCWCRPRVFYQATTHYKPNTWKIQSSLSHFKFKNQVNFVESLEIIYC